MDFGVRWTWNLIPFPEFSSHVVLHKVLSFSETIPFHIKWRHLFHRFVCFRNLIILYDVLLSLLLELQKLLVIGVVILTHIQHKYGKKGDYHGPTGKQR